MTNEKFDALVRRLEQEAAANPRRYTARVVLLAALGYAYIGVVLAILIGLVIGVGAVIVSAHAGILVKVLIPLIVAIGYTARALWVQFDKPTGIPLRREDAPRLFDEAAALATALRAPHPDVVLLTSDYNASVTLIPRLGIFGFPTVYLCVGLPLFAMLSPEGARAVLAHEFAHLSRAHGAFGGWCYRVRATWAALGGDDDAKPARLFRKFFSWYSPLFAAYTFVLMRRHEYEADRFAAGVVGARTMAQALLDIEVRGLFLRETVWPSVWRESIERPEPPDDVYGRLTHLAVVGLPSDVTERGVATAFKWRTDSNDTHPALQDRVTALLAPAVVTDGDAPLVATRRVERTGIEWYLDPSHERLAAELASQWRTGALPAWAERHATSRQAAEGLTRLTDKAATEPLDRDEQFQFASWTEELLGADTALPLYERLLVDVPDHLGANFCVGRLRLAAGDASGLQLLDRAMTVDADAIIPACQLAIAFLRNEGRLDEANSYRERFTARVTQFNDIQRELSTVTAKDRYAESTVPGDVVESIRRQLDEVTGVEAAYLVLRTSVTVGPPTHVLVVVPRIARSLRVSDTRMRQEHERIAAALSVPPGIVPFVVDRSAKKPLAPIRKVATSLIYDGAATMNATTSTAR